ncbi:nicotinate-nucleotide adenylyltransferase [uncultured Aquimarina sp.]|uniref:nicotinate-nucleotide adenylyltransferase n=1 Tax=uncultured Aquimarina sp. TaxID=575652 RepID=UPI00262178F6|nr:nicotinate-nucleotide adenylyltransferase [uncultured Aquimarina sp.]
MKKIVVSLLFLGLTIPSFSQKTEELPEVVIIATNYKYLRALDSGDEPLSVDLLQKEVASYDLKNSDVYEDEYELYHVSFYIPDGKILAAYDKNGKVLRTIEKFKNVKLPRNVIEAVTKRFPGWVIAKDVYLVNYHSEKGVTKKYKLRLQNGKKRIKVKTDEFGKFL